MFIIHNLHFAIYWFRMHVVVRQSWFLFHKFQQTYSWQWRISETLPSPNFQSHGLSHWRYSKSQVSIWHWLSQICHRFYKSLWRYTNQTFIAYICIYILDNTKTTKFICMYKYMLSIYLSISLSMQRQKQWWGEKSWDSMAWCYKMW